MKTRNGFVSNSSSSSFIVIYDDDITEEINKLKQAFQYTPLVVDSRLGETEFGWQHEKYKDFGSKIIFAYLQAAYLSQTEWVISEKEYINKGKMWLEMLETVIKKNLGVSEIIWNIATDYEEKTGNKEHAYIDHQSASYEGKNTEIFNDETTLTNFLFNPNSFIRTGNDNDGY